MKISITMVALSLLAVFLKLSESAEKQIAVINLDAIGISRTDGLTFTERLRSELVKTNEFRVMERDKMDDILKEQGFQQTGCTTNECAVEIGRLLNISQICAGSVGKVGTAYTISLRLIDVQTGQIITTVTEDCNCPIETVLTNSIRTIALKLAEASRTGILRFEGWIGGSEVTVNGKRITEGNFEIKVPLGIYDIQSTKSGHKSRFQQIHVREEKIYSVPLDMKPKTRMDAMMRSALLPGWGQAYQEKYIRAWIYPMAIIACGAGSYYMIQNYNKQIDEYNNIKEEYMNAFEELEMRILYQKMNDAYDDVEKSEKIRNALFIATGVLWLWNIVDTLLLPPAWEKNTGVSINTYGNKYYLGLTLSLR